MRTPQQILEECRDIMPFELKECFDPYMIECMEIYAKEYNEQCTECTNRTDNWYDDDSRNWCFDCEKEIKDNCS